MSIQSVMYIISVGDFANAREVLHSILTLKTAFKEVKDPETEVEVNVGMMRRVARAVKNLSSSFKFLVYPGGTRVSLYRPVPFSCALLMTKGVWDLPPRRHFQCTFSGRTSRPTSSRLRQNSFLPSLPRHAYRRICERVLVVVRTVSRRYHRVHA